MPSRVLPIPGGPSSVTRRISGFDKYSRIRAISDVRPINDVVVAGIFERGDLMGARQGGTSLVSIGADLTSPRANRRNDPRSFSGILKISASRSMTCAEG